MNCEGVLVAGIQKDTSNIFLRSLSPPDYASISRHFTGVVLAPKDIIVRTGQPIEFLDFPESGILALNCDAGARSACLTALVGREGYIGWSALMEVRLSSHHIRAGGEGARLLRIEIARMLRLMHERPSLRVSLMRFVHSVMIQMNATIVSSKTDPVERRLARLILMHHDRANDGDICVTHQDLADMLVVRRASITDALHVMEGNQLIASSRNRLVMRNRPGLCLVAGDGYGVAEEHYSQYVAPLFAIR
ncbi:Crp/Fnr family transcriptional regulator [Sphingobium cupriresistens]|uniref:Cyclic nucleotide-binding protein n=2 Tax=Sphingobium cupriresistens TaxID=1132417 RepID=A0A0J7Y399_9SPHN|nr:cyclic nucleotide-binding protein [Sphingobium cupriresistens LL01]RYM07917.1 Crp/Fnr family transcriptional regulator [Sphingobium cupriresistens]